MWVLYVADRGDKALYLPVLTLTYGHKQQVIIKRESTLTLR